MANKKDNSIILLVLIPLVVLAMFWAPIIGIFAFICTLWVIFFQYYLVPKCEGDFDYGLLWNPYKIAEERGWSIEKVQQQLSKVWNLGIVKKKEKEALEMLWDIKGISKSKRFYFKHTKHIEIILVIVVPVSSMIAIIMGYYGW